MVLKGNAAWRLLTHHQPNGRSPALEKGGYLARRARGPCAKGDYLQGADGFEKKRSLGAANPPPAIRLVPRPCKGRIYARAGAHCFLASTKALARVLLVHSFAWVGYTLGPAAHCLMYCKTTAVVLLHNCRFNRTVAINRAGRQPALLSALYKGGGPLRLRNGGGLGAAIPGAVFLYPPRTNNHPQSTLPFWRQQTICHKTIQQKGHHPCTTKPPETVTSNTLPIISEKT